MSSTFSYLKKLLSLEWFFNSNTIFKFAYGSNIELANTLQQTKPSSIRLYNWLRWKGPPAQPIEMLMESQSCIAYLQKIFHARRFKASRLSPHPRSTGFCPQSFQVAPRASLSWSAEQQQQQQQRHGVVQLSKVFLAHRVIAARRRAGTIGHCRRKEQFRALQRLLQRESAEAEWVHSNENKVWKSTWTRDRPLQSVLFWLRVSWPEWCQFCLSWKRHVLIFL